MILLDRGTPAFFPLPQPVPYMLLLTFLTNSEERVQTGGNFTQSRV